MLTKQQILAALDRWIRQRPGLEFDNYGNISAYRSELRSITRDLNEARQLMRAVELRDSITAEDLLQAFSAYSGRLSIKEADGKAELSYCTGQYWPTEYRRAVCAVLASALWARKRADMPPVQYIVGGREKFGSLAEAKAFADKMSPVITAIEERYNGLRAGDWIRQSFKREFGRGIANRWFN